MILAGFDLHTKTGAKADKLVQFSIQIDSLLSSAENGKIQAQIKYTLQLACSSAECEAFNQEVKYDLRVHWTAILGTGFLSKTETIDAGQTWEKKTPSKDTVPERLALSGNPNFPLMTVGIKGISMTLDAEHHILGWESWINPLSDFKNMLWLEAKLNFVQHQPSMYAAFKRNYTGFPKPPAKWVVHREAGQANWQMEICQLMFREAEINKSKVHSNVTWKTRHGKQKDVF